MSDVPEQILEVSAFGEVLSVEKTPITQMLAINGLTDKVEKFEFLSGTATTNGSEFVVSLGTTANSFASILSSREIPYRAGQGSEGDLSARFSAGVANTSQLAGLTSATDSLSFGYNDVDFGITRRANGFAEIQELEVTSATTGAGDVTVTIDGTPFTVAVTIDTVQVNAIEISDSLTAQVPGWIFTANDDTVVALQINPTPAGSFVFALDTATGTAATWTQIKAGVAATTNFTAQVDWNVNPIPSLDPTKGNIYRISLQYLGYGGIPFFVEDSASGRLVLVHVIPYANNNVVPSLGDPTFRIGWTVSSTGGTTDLVVAGASAAGFIQGKDIITEQSRSSSMTLIAVGTTALNLLTIRNRTVRGQRRNRSDTHLLSASGFTDSAKGAVIEVIINATIAGDPVFQYIDKDMSTTEFHSSSGAVTGGTVIGTLTLLPGDNLDLEKIGSRLTFNQTLTLAARVVAVPASDITGNVLFQEDI